MPSIVTDAATKSPAEKTVGDWRADFFRASLRVDATERAW